MKVAVSAHVEDYARVRRAMGKLRELGFEITCDWLANIDRFPMGNPPPSLRAQYARDALSGAVCADVLLVLTPGERSQLHEPPIEMGAALAVGVPVIIAGAGRNRSRFSDLCRVRALTDDEGIEAIVRFATILTEQQARSA